MGDICNMNDLDRFLRSTEGQEHLDELQQKLVGRQIESVSFSNEVQHIVITLHLDNGEAFEVSHASLDVDAIRESFAEVLKREYLIDYPDREQEFSG